MSTTEETQEEQLPVSTKEEKTEDVQPVEEEEDNEDREDVQEHPLERKWVLWYDPANTKDWDQWFNSLHKVYTFSTIEDFWRLYNNIETPSNLKQRTSYFVFVDGVKPMWEDEPNRNGGKWFLEFDTRSSKFDLDNFWLYALLGVIGENLEGSDNILGIQVNAIKSNRGKLSVWTKDAFAEETNLKIGKALKDLWKLDYSISYLAHDDSIKAKASRHGNVMYSV